LGPTFPPFAPWNRNSSMTSVFEPVDVDDDDDELDFVD
jgi:hypothetical protein